MVEAGLSEAGERPGAAKQRDSPMGYQKSTHDLGAFLIKRINHYDYFHHHRYQAF